MDARNGPSKCPTTAPMKRPKSMYANTLRPKRLLDGTFRSGQNLQVLLCLGLTQATSSKKAFFLGIQRGRTWPLTL